MCVGTCWAATGDKHHQSKGTGHQDGKGDVGCGFQSSTSQDKLAQHNWPRACVLGLDTHLPPGQAVPQRKRSGPLSERQQLLCKDALPQGAPMTMLSFGKVKLLQVKVLLPWQPAPFTLSPHSDPMTLDSRQLLLCLLPLDLLLRNLFPGSSTVG